MLRQKKAMKHLWACRVDALVKALWIGQYTKMHSGVAGKLSGDTRNGDELFGQNYNDFNFQPLFTLTETSQDHREVHNQFLCSFDAPCDKYFRE